MGAAIALLANCAGAHGETTGAGRRSNAVTIEVATPQRITVQRRVEVTGTLISPDAAEISSQVAGVVAAVDVELGQEVVRGQVLVRLDGRELALELERAQSALRQTEAQLGLEGEATVDPPADEELASVRAARAGYEDARAQLNRTQQLSTRGLLSVADREAAETRLKVAQATYQASLDSARSLKASLQDRRAAVTLARKRVDDTSIRAPVEGAVTARSAQRGSFIRENTPVVTLMQLNPLRLNASVQERFADTIRAGMMVHFTVEPFQDAGFEGRIAFVSPAIEHVTRSFTVEAVVANGDRRLKPGFFAKGEILTHVDADVLAVPAEAVSTLAGISSVFVVEGEKVRQQQIVIGERQGALLEVVQGLTGQEQLARSNLNQLATDVSVTIRRNTASAGATR